MNRWLTTCTRIFLGIVFLGAGVNGYFVMFGHAPFIETSPEAMILFQFDYLLIVEKTLEVVCGALLLFNRFIPLALLLLTPIVTNILLLHIFVDHSLIVLALMIAIALIIMLIHYKNYFIIFLHNKPRL